MIWSVQVKFPSHFPFLNITTEKFKHFTMAETVQKNMELMVKELQQFKEMKILNDEEIKELLRRRKHFEYKINGVRKRLCDYQSYIKYETALLKLIRIRRANPRNRCSAERRVIIRVKRLYDIAIKRFPQNLSVAFDYFAFCQEVKFVSEARSVLSTLLKNHSQKEEVWHLASRFYFTDLKDSETALKTLRKGLALHKRSKLLFKEIFRMEVLVVVNEISEMKMENELLIEKQTVCVKKLDLYLDQMIKLVNCVDTYMDVLDFLKDHTFTLSVQKSILQYLHNNHSDDIVKWKSGGCSYDVTYNIST